MKVGTTVNLCTYGDTAENTRIVSVGYISAVGMANELNSKTCYAVRRPLVFQDALFYMKPELGTCRYLNVGNAAFWIEEPDSILTTATTDPIVVAGVSIERTDA